MNKGTIAAIATAPGRGGVGVIRISGSNLLPFAFALTGKSPKPRYATLADFQAADGSTIDTGLLLYFPNPHSFTGEDVLELQGHGGPVVLQLLLARCLDLGARLAEPGEFSRRAFLNGKMDLAQAEAVADLIDAATASAARSAVRSLQGEFSRAIGELNEELINLRMLVEATLDFPEEDIDFLQGCRCLRPPGTPATRSWPRSSTGPARASCCRPACMSCWPASRMSASPRCSTAWPATSWPSSRRLPAPTRDALRSTIQIEGIPLHIIDTAGLRETEDEVERIGIERSWKEIERSDVVLLLVDSRTGVTEADREILERLPKNLQRITIYNKIDLAGRQSERHDEADGVAVSLSAKANQGIDLLRQELLRIAGWHQTEDVFIARERHLRALATAQEHVAAARSVVEGVLPALELFAEELRLAQQALGEITGEFTADDLLGVIFSRFCIGK